MSRLSDRPLQDFLAAGPHMRHSELEKLLHALLAAQARHPDESDPMDVLAAFGGFETAVMVGAMLVAASKRQLIIVDGLAACAALKAAASIAAPVTDYALFCRSSSDPGLDSALREFKASALLELGLQSSDGCGAAMSWPLIRAAATLLTDLQDVADVKAASSARAGHEAAS
jgi:nicotinate-nucleotide--dimethylbenzimidazole phosphoribosyltransferase